MSLLLALAGSGVAGNATGALAQITLTAITGTAQVTQPAANRGSNSARKRTSYVVDRFSDFPKKPSKRNDDEECLLLMMI